MMPFLPIDSTVMSTTVEELDSPTSSVPDLFCNPLDEFFDTNNEFFDTEDEEYIDSMEEEEGLAEFHNAVASREDEDETTSIPVTANAAMKNCLNFKP